MPRRAPACSDNPVQICLSRRQRECLVWAERGKSSRDIATILGLSSRTVEEHFAEACRKLGVRTRMQAVLEAGRRGLLTEPEGEIVSREERSW
ncbi:helix-turn-helix transcriptional regulator [Caulobacter sp. 73W]|uniref:Helix-turn-helix transcriptional regulator n=1 Tax=Caulobacter sp. 73W TaxID=3161137 RepID=A0AB39KZL4_9CAUL